MGKCKKQDECPKCMPGWLAAFGDLMSLLLCFFVLLLSMSSMDAKKINEAMGSLQGAMSVLEGGTKSEISKERQQKATPMDQQDESAQKLKTIKRTLIEMNEMSEATGGSAQATLEESEDGFMIRLPANLLFKRGDAKIEDENAILFLKRMALIIDKLPKTMRVNVIGHTDDGNAEDSPIFKDNWSLSTQRAISVTKELISNQIEPKLLTACGKAEYDPIATNLTPVGKEKNRRVELYFFSPDKKDEKDAKSILDTVQ